MNDSEDFRRENVYERNQIRFKRFVVQELIGVGGMAEVYRARAETPAGEKVAIVIKRIKKEHSKNKSFIQMFLDEAKLSARMKHPNIVEVFEYGEDLGVHYLAMEYIDGLHLQAAHKRYEEMHGSPLPWQVVVLIIRDVLHALEYAHELTDEHGEHLGLIHRDVNLDNVMITHDGRVKLLDFGIVKAREGIRAAETAAGVLKGKFGYMSPEQVAGQPLKPGSDVFSTGIIFHELLTGRRLFFGEDDLSILIAVKSGPIPDPVTISSDVPDDVSRVVLKALERELEKRYQAAGEMIFDLNAIIERYGISDKCKADLTAELMEPGKQRRDEKRIPQKTLEAWANDGLNGFDQPSEQGFESGASDDIDEPDPDKQSPPHSAYTPSGRARKKTKYMWGGSGSGEEAEDNLREVDGPGLEEGESTVVDATVPDDTSGTVPEISLTEAQTRILEEGEDISTSAETGVSAGGLAEAQTRILEEGEDISTSAETGVSVGGLAEAQTRILEEGEDISTSAETGVSVGGLAEAQTRILEEGEDAAAIVKRADDNQVKLKHLEETSKMAAAQENGRGGKQNDLRLVTAVIIGAGLLVIVILYLLGVI